MSSTLEKLLARERPAVLAGLVGAIALSWLYLVPAARDMYGPMDGLSAWMMQSDWDVRYFILIFLMWAVMMVGMMLPSAAPAILLYARVQRNSDGVEAPAARIHAFTGGYLLAWTGFSIAATLLQYVLSRATLLSPMMESASPLLAGGLLIIAGLYQWTSLKQACLTNCRSPAAFITQHFRPGVGGALRLGAHHGLYCVGCCWALMMLLFAGGVMNLLWIAAITVFVLLEKLAPYGAQGGRLSGALLVLAGFVVLA
ncbi:MAG TPA: DUF2182 domain-containing protein [Verrucomicrobiae bacterium]|nr:DUF2182 domain-containing protein [Verrucomicrobiae bacterium]